MNFSYAFATNATSDKQKKLRSTPNQCRVSSIGVLLRSTEAAELVFKGTYEDEELTDILQMFLNNMKRVASEEISSSEYLSAENFMKKMKSWKEKN